MILAAAMLWSCALPEGEGAASSVPNGPEPGALEDILRELRQAVPEPEGELRGVWIAYLDLVPLLREKSEDQFTEGFSAMAESCREAGFNALVVQVRPFGDSFYPSAYFSWSALTGPLAYDPMAIMTRIAAEKDLEFHAWLNPMRAMTLEEAAAVPEEFPIRQWYDDPALRAERLILLDGRVYLNPASAEVRALIADGAAELAEKAMGPERGPLTAFEKACDDTLTAYLDGAKSVPFGVEVVVGYLYAKESELTAVRTVLSGRLAGLDGELIRSRLRNTYL